MFVDDGGGQHLSLSPQGYPGRRGNMVAFLVSAVGLKSGGGFGDGRDKNLAEMATVATRSILAMTSRANSLRLTLPYRSRRWLSSDKCLSSNME